MRRPDTFAGGKFRTDQWIQHTIVCDVCDATIDLDYRSNAVTPNETRRDLYRALRAGGWMATITRGRVVPLCPVCGLAEGHGHG